LEQTPRAAERKPANIQGKESYPLVGVGVGLLWSGQKGLVVATAPGDSRDQILMTCQKSQRGNRESGQNLLQVKEKKRFHTKVRLAGYDTRGEP